MVKANSQFCRACGSDMSTGWQSSEEIDYQSVDIPDGIGPDDFQDAFAEDAPRRSMAARVFQIAAILVAIGILLLALKAY